MEALLSGYHEPIQQRILKVYSLLDPDRDHNPSQHSALNEMTFKVALLTSLLMDRSYDGSQEFGSEVMVKTGERRVGYADLCIKCGKTGAMLELKWLPISSVVTVVPVLKTSPNTTETTTKRDDVKDLTTSTAALCITPQLPTRDPRKARALPSFQKPKKTVNFEIVATGTKEKKAIETKEKFNKGKAAPKNPDKPPEKRKVEFAAEPAPATTTVPHYVRVRELQQMTEAQLADVSVMPYSYTSSIPLSSYVDEVHKTQATLYSENMMHAWFSSCNIVHVYSVVLLAGNSVWRHHVLKK